MTVCNADVPTLPKDVLIAFSKYLNKYRLSMLMLPKYDLASSDYCLKTHQMELRYHPLKILFKSETIYMPFSYVQKFS